MKMDGSGREDEIKQKDSVTLVDGAGNRSRSFEASICQCLPVRLERTLTHTHTHDPSFLYYLYAKLAGGAGRAIQSKARRPGFVFRFIPSPHAHTECIEFISSPACSNRLLRPRLCLRTLINARADAV